MKAYKTGFVFVTLDDMLLQAFGKHGMERGEVVVSY